MNELDKWAAAKCGVEIDTYNDYVKPFPGTRITPVDDIATFPGWRFDGEFHCYQWDLCDSRCREIVREHFHIETGYTGTGKNQYYAYSITHSPPTLDVDARDYATIAEAEMACIEAIWANERAKTRQELGDGSAT